MGDAAFRTKVLADFSRLLELELGRRMIEGNQLTGHQVTITPTTLAPGKFVARPTDGDEEALGLAAPDSDTSTYVAVDFRGLTQAARLALLQDLRIRHRASTGGTGDGRRRGARLQLRRWHGIGITGAE